MLKNRAFTLAEVLITLGIIGVVAAMTLPTLIQNYQKQVYVNQLKKAYSVLGNAINKMAVDEGVVDWKQTYCGSAVKMGNGGDENPAYKECLNRIAKQFKILKFKGYNENCTGTWCKGGEEQDSKYWFPTTYDMFDGNDNSGSIMTSDGFTYIFVFSNVADVYVDINGRDKGPNKAGRDIFEFIIDYNSNKIIPEGTIGTNSYSYSGGCSESYPFGCTAKVLQEGKMNY